MDAIKQNLILKARTQHHSIYPCGSRKSLDDCFTVDHGRILFWFNTDDMSTHVVTSDVLAQAA